MLAVDRHELASAAPACRIDEVAGHNERLLVRQSNALAVLERGERGIEPRGANDGVEHDIDIVTSRRGDQAVAATLPIAMAIGAVVHDADKGWMKLVFLFP